MKDFKILFFYPNEPMVGVTPSNIAILSACLKQAGFQTKLFDCTSYRSITSETQDDVRTKMGLVKKTDLDNYTHLKDTNIYEDFEKTIKEYKPDLVAFTVVDSTIKFSLSFVDLINHSKTRIVFGGVGATFNYEKILATRKVDCVCIGEGEEAIVELCEALYKKDWDAYRSIRNLYFSALIPEKNVIYKNPLRPLVDLETLPTPDFDIFEEWRFYRPFMGRVIKTIQFDFDRGCQHGCTYCAAPSLRKVFINNSCGKYYRVKSNDKIFTEMKYFIEKYNLDFVWISSETLLDLPLNQFKEFADRYKREINLPFWCQSRLDTFTEEKTKILSEMGCENISIGLEHGSEDLRKKLLNKHISNDVVINAVKMMQKNNIFPTFNNMIGLPDETREDVFKTVQLNRELTQILNGKHNLNVFTFIPFAGTKLRQICLDKGYIEDDDELPVSFFRESMLNMPTMTKEEIKGLEKTLALYIMLPHVYWLQIQIAERDDAVGNEMFESLIKLIKK